MTIEIWLIISLAVSMALNIFLFIFSRDISKRYYVVVQNISDLVELLVSYREHLKSIYSMQMFYGDETLEGLVSHTRDLANILENDYGDLSLIENIIEYEESEENEKEEEQQEQDVFYVGTRERNT